MMNLSTTVFIFVLLVPFILASPLDISSSSWGQEIKQTGKLFVKFYAPWCGFCIKLAPIWDDLSNDIELTQQNIRIANVDCTVDKELCTHYDVTGFPTLKLFENGKVQTFTSKDRDFESLKKFALSTTPSQEVVHYSSSNKNEPIKWKADSDILHLTGPSLPLVKEGKWLVAFYGDWCGFCRKLSVQYEQVATELKGEVHVARVNIMNMTPFQKTLNITAVPTIKYFEDDKMYDFLYQSQPAEKFVEWVRKETYKTLPSEPNPFPQRNFDRSMPMPKLVEALNFLANAYGNSVKPTSSTPQQPKAAAVQKSAFDQLEDLVRKYTGYQYLDFQQQEALIGGVAVVVMFLLGFILGRVTAPSAPTPKQTKPTKTKKAE